MKILLFQPPRVEGMDVVREEFCHGKTNLSVNPYDIVILSSVFKENGFNVKLFDCQGLSWSKEELFKQISHTTPDWIITQSTFASFSEDNALFNKIKKEFDIKIICNFNPPLTKKLAEIFLSYSDVDYVTIDEPYYSPFELVSEGKKDGFAYKENGRVIYTRKKELKNIDELPIPDYESLPMQVYDKIFINGIRDCPFSCTFCTQASAERLKKRGYYSAERLFDEVKIIHTKCHKRLFLISDSSPFLYKKRIRRFCEMVIGDGLDIQWECNGRIGLIDYSLIKLMKKAGCTDIVLGVESGSNEMLKTMKKGITAEDSQKAIKSLRELGMPVGYHTIIGLPGETKGTIKDTIDFINKTKPDNFSVNIATPFPGTEFYEFCIENGLCSESDFFSKKFDHRTRQLIKSDLDLNKEKQRIIKKTMFTPWYIKGKIKKYLKGEYQYGVCGMAKNGFRLILNMYRRSL